MTSFRSITRADDFRRVLEQGTRIGADGMTIHAVAGDGPEARLGIAVTARGAVQRNRVKRRLRAAMRAASVPPGTDVMVRARAETAGLDFQVLVTAINGACRKAAR